MSQVNLVLHEGGFLPVVAGLKEGDTVEIRMDVIKVNGGLVLYPRGRYTRAGLAVKAEPVYHFDVALPFAGSMVGWLVPVPHRG